MKILFLIAILAMTLASCNNKIKETENYLTENSTKSEDLSACSMHPEVTGEKEEKCAKCSMELTEPMAQKRSSHNQDDSTFVAHETTTTSSTPLSTNDIITNYLKIKNALTKNDTNGTATATQVLYKIFNSTNINDLTVSQKNEYVDIADDAKEYTEHIVDNTGEIDHQREHFAILSKDINDLIILLGSNQKLFQDYCPMYIEEKGAIWISETQEIKNPYYGFQMLTCAVVL